MKVGGLNSVLRKISKGVRKPQRAFRFAADALMNPMRRTSRRFQFIGNPENRSESEYGDYVSFVRAASIDNRLFSRFKSHPSYRAVLEHVTRDEGEQYLKIVQRQSPEFLDIIERFKINDTIGSPIRYRYEPIGEISPTTLRYIKVASDLKKYFGATVGQKLVEIGVGYGGQLLVSDQVFAIEQCRLLDLVPVLSLVQRYLEGHILNCSYQIATLNQTPAALHYDLAISNYAFSELPAHLQTKYIDKILSKSARGYLTMNSGVDGSVFQRNKLPLSELRARLPKFDVFDETPLTAPNNYIIVWGHAK